MRPTTLLAFLFTSTTFAALDTCGDHQSFFVANKCCGSPDRKMPHGIAVAEYFYTTAAVQDAFLTSVNSFTASAEFQGFLTAIGTPDVDVTTYARTDGVSGARQLLTGPADQFLTYNTHFYNGPFNTAFALLAGAPASSLSPTVPGMNSSDVVALASSFLPTLSGSISSGLLPGKAAVHSPIVGTATVASLRAAGFMTVPYDEAGVDSSLRDEALLDDIQAKLGVAPGTDPALLGITLPGGDA